MRHSAPPFGGSISLIFNAFGYSCDMQTRPPALPLTTRLISGQHGGVDREHLQTRGAGPARWNRWQARGARLSRAPTPEQQRTMEAPRARPRGGADSQPGVHRLPHGMVTGSACALPPDPGPSPQPSRRRRSSALR